VGSFVCEYVGEVIGIEEARRRLKAKEERRSSASSNGIVATLERGAADEGRAANQGFPFMNYIIVLREMTAAADKSSNSSATGADSDEAFLSKAESTGSIIETIVDAEFVSNVGHFINHSCNPNLSMFPVRTSKSSPRLALFANRDIPALEELTFHYGGVGGGDGGGGGAGGGGGTKKLCQDGSTPKNQSEFKPTPGSQSSLNSQPTQNLIPCRCLSTNCLGFLPFDVGLL